MTPMRVSTTTLESFRLFVENDWMEESELIATIKGEFVPSYKIAVGMAYHAIIEKPGEHRIEGEGLYARDVKYVTEAGGWRSVTLQYSSAAVDPMLELIDPRGLFEVKTTRALDDCVVVCKCDHICGATISELKSTLSAFDAEKYLASCQWKFEAWAFEASSVIYRVACLADTDGEPFGLRSLENLNVYPYPGMASDCRYLLKRFVDYVKVRKLDELLRERQRKIEERSGKNENQMGLFGAAS